MIAERTLTAVMRRLNRRFISHDQPRATPSPPPRPARSTCSTATSRSASGCARTAASTASSTTTSAPPRYYHALREEMRMVADLGYDFTSMYLGGGTPTILLDELCETIDLARELFSIREVSCETSPNHLGDEMVEKLHDRVQRMSVGVQSFDDMLLDQMDRYTKYGCGTELFEAVCCVAGKFHSVNVDMIFNFPSQTEEMLHRDIDAAARDRREPDDVLPADGLAGDRQVAGAHDRQDQLREGAALLPHPVRRAVARLRAVERVDVLEEGRRDDRRVHRRLRRVRRHRLRRRLLPRRTRLRQHLLALRVPRLHRRRPAVGLHDAATRTARAR